MILQAPAFHAIVQTVGEPPARRDCNRSQRIPTRNITNSEWRQINPTDTEGKVTLVVGNGEYKQSYFAFGLGTYVRF